MTSESVSKPIGLQIGHAEGGVQVTGRETMGSTQETRWYRVYYPACGHFGRLNELQIKQRGRSNASRCPRCAAHKPANGESYARKWGTASDARARVSFGGGSSNRMVDLVIARLGGGA